MAVIEGIVSNFEKLYANNFYDESTREMLSAKMDEFADMYITEFIKAQEEN